MGKKLETMDVQPAVAEFHEKTLYQRVADYLDSTGWSYSPNEDKGYFALTLRLNDASVRAVVDTYQATDWLRIMVFVTFPMFVPEPRRLLVAEALSRINYAIIFGNFEMDMNDGEIRVRTCLESDTFIGQEMIVRTLHRALDLANEYQAKLLAIAFGNATPVEALEVPTRDENVTLQ